MRIEGLPRFENTVDQMQEPTHDGDNAHPDLLVCDVMPNPRLARKDDFASVQHEDDLTLGRMAAVAILPSAFRSTVGLLSSSAVLASKQGRICTHRMSITPYPQKTSSTGKISPDQVAVC
jgi:hypothetical protein